MTNPKMLAAAAKAFRQQLLSPELPPDAPLLPQPDDAETVERMAKAIFASQHTEAELNAYPWESKYEWIRNEYRDMARAALAALWEAAP